MSEQDNGPEVTPDADSNLNESQESTAETHVNPAWQPIFDEFDNDPSMKFISDKIKEKLTPHLTRQDQAYQEVTTKYAPYKDYVDNNISPELINQSINAFRYLNENPKEVHQKLSEFLGITVAEAKKLEESIPDESDDDSDPRLKTLEEKLNQLSEAEQRRLEEKQAADWGKKIDSDVEDLRKVHEANPALKDIPYDYVRVQLLNIANQQVARLENIDIKKAYKEFETTATMLRSYPNRGAQAPRVTPTGGGGTTLPVETNSGKVPEEIARAPFAERMKWFKAQGIVK